MADHREIRHFHLFCGLSGNEREGEEEMNTSIEAYAICRTGPAGETEPMLWYIYTNRRVACSMLDAMGWEPNAHPVKRVRIEIVENLHEKS